jgi:TP901 family phage tail tape measure protein
MANDLKILVTASLNTGKSIGEINTAIGGIEKKIKGLKLNIEVNDKVLGTLNKFNEQMKKISSAALNTGKVIEEAINPDGSRIKRTYYDGLKGEFSEISKAAKKTAQDQMKSLEEVNGEYNKVLKTVEKYNATQKKIGSKVTLANGNDTRTVNLNSKDQVVGYTDTTNTAKDDKQTQQLIADKQKLRQELVKLGQQGNVTAQQLANVARSVSGVKDTSGLQQAQNAYAQLADRAKLAEQMAQGRERGAVASIQAEHKLATTQAQTAGRNIELTRQEIQQGKELEAEIKRRLELYQREKQIQATNLNTRLGGQINQTALNNQLQNVMSATPNQFRSLEELRNFTQQANTGFRELSAGIQNAQHHALKFGDALKTAFSSFGIWMISGTALMQSLNFFKQGISFVNELNRSLTEIAIVTGQTQQQVNSLGYSYNKLAQQMGVTTNEIGMTSASLYRQGLSAEEATKRMKTVIEYAKISSLDIKTASEIMTAAINSVGVSATKASDVWSFMGDATATGADEIGRAFQKVGGSAGALKLDFSKVSSWIAIVSSRTRESAETIGQSMKGILARIQSLKENGFDEDTNVNQVAKALASINVNLMDSSGQFRNFGTVMDEIGSKWKDLDSRQRAYIATTVAGEKICAA